MFIPYPPNPYILVPLSRGSSLFHIEMNAETADLSKPSLGVRRFELYSSSISHAEYVEVAK